MDKYATHIPVTARALCVTGVLFPERPILECGCGDYSTPMIALMKGQRRHVIYSSDQGWSDRYLEIVDETVTIEPSAEHKWGDVTFDGSWGLCIMDSEELVKHRIEHIPLLLNICSVVVMHDVRTGLIPIARYGVTYKGCGEPWTWIGSQTIRVAEWFKR